jgi:hypothetical protein
MKLKAEVINYFDVWGNKKDGFEINNMCSEGFIEVDENNIQKSTLQELKKMDFLKKHVRLNQFHVEDSYPFYEFYQKKDNQPVFRIEIKEGDE